MQDAIAKAKDDIGRRDAQTAVRDLSAHLNDQYAFHDAILSLLDSSPSPMRQELIKEARSQRPDFDLNAHDKEGKTVLDLAVQHDDRAFARYLLGLGARPEKVFLGTATIDMQALLTSWRRKNLLYAHFNEGNRQSWTDQDQLLYEGRHEEVREILADEIAKDGGYKLWERAMHAGQRDILRALLVISTQNELRELAKHKHLVGMCKKALQDDPGLSAVLKEFPYQSAKRGNPENLNEEVKFSGTNEHIVCRHLATYQQMQQAQDSRIKFDYNKLSSRKTIEKNVEPGIEKTYVTLKAQASETHLINNKKFGHFLARQFEAMEKDGKQSKLMLVESTNHAMNLGLRIKEKNGEKSYVVKFFDPNDTTTGTRSKANSVQTFETQALDSYITNADKMKDYYPELVGMSMIFVRPEEAQASAPISSGFNVGRTLTSMDIKDSEDNEDSEGIDATVMWHLMSEGFSGNLRQLRDQLTSLPEDKRIELLAATSDDGYPALYMSMHAEHVEAIKAYGELLASASIPEDQLIKLLAATNAKGYPALYMSMHGGKVDAIKAYDGLLKQSEPIPEDQFIELIAGKSSKGTPALFMVLRQGNAEVVKAYGDLVKSLPPDKQVDLLLAKKISHGQRKGSSGLKIALKNNHFKAANALLQLLTQLAPDLSLEKRAMLQKELKNHEKTFKQSTLTNPSALQEWRKVKRSFSALKTELSK